MNIMTNGPFILIILFIFDLRNRYRLRHNYQIKEKTLAHRYQIAGQTLEICSRETSDELGLSLLRTTSTTTDRHHFCGTRNWLSGLLGIYAVT